MSNHIKPTPPNLLALMQCRQLAKTEEERYVLGALVGSMLASLAPRRPAPASVPLSEPITAPATFISDESMPVWGQILGLLWLDVCAGRFLHPYRLEDCDGKRVIIVRCRHVMDHIRRAPHLTEWRLMSASQQRGGDRWLKRHWSQAGALLVAANGQPMACERTIGGARIGHMRVVLEEHARHWAEQVKPIVPLLA